MQFNITDEVSELLPDVVHQMIDVIGLVQTEKIIKHFGGITFRFTDGHCYFPKLIDVIGNNDAIKLRNYFKCEQVYIPRCEAALRMLRNMQFKADYDYLTKAENKSGRMAMMELCPKYNISDRHGWAIVGADLSIVQSSLLF